MRFSQSTDSRAWENLFFVGLFLLFSLMLYFNSMKGEFHFDDYVYIVNAPQIRHLNETGERIFFRPLYPDRSLVEFSFALNYAVHGLNYKGYQIVNIVIHAINVFLIYLLLTKFLQKTTRTYPEFYDKNFSFYSFIVSILFLAHPLAVNSVAYITQRHGLMATLFYLSSFYCYVQAMDSIGWKRAAMLAAVLLFFSCAIHCKPMALTLPLVLISYSLLFLQKPTRRAIVVLICSCAVFSAYGCWYAKSSGLLSSGILSTAGFETENLWSAKTHFMTEIHVVLHYIKLIVMPLPGWLCADRLSSLTTSCNLSFAAALLVHILIFSLAGFLLLHRGCKMIFFGTTWFYLTLLPYFFVPVQDVMVDYKTYLPSAGLILIAGEVVYLSGNKYRKKQVGIFAAAGIVFFLWSAAGRVKTFETEISFWTDVISKEGNKERALNNRGLAWKRSGNYSMAMKDFSQAISLFPEHYAAYANLGDLCLKIGENNEAIKLYRKYLELLPKSADAHLRIGSGYMTMKQWRDAAKHYHKAVQLDAANAVAWYNLGLSYARMKKWDQAKYFLRKAVKINPDYYKAYGSLGAVFHSAGQLVQAEILYRKALGINPKFVDAAYNLAIIHLQEGNKKNNSDQTALMKDIAQESNSDMKK